MGGNLTLTRPTGTFPYYISCWSLFLLSILYHSLLISLYAIAYKLTIIHFPQHPT